MSKLTCCKVAAAFIFAIILPAAAWAQQSDASDTDSPVVPPVPLIQKRKPNAISIPASDAARFEQKAAAATNVRVRSESASEPKAASTTPKVNAGSVVSTNAKVGSTFGYRRDPFTRREKFHSGCDIKAHWGQPVGASLPGTVLFAGWSHGYGNMIVVEHGGGIATHYAHLSSFAVEPGEHVERGSIIGYAGSTGRATSPHLHYEVRIDGTAVNPLDPIALDESSDFFKNAAAVRLITPTLAAQSTQVPAPDPVKPASERPQTGVVQSTAASPRADSGQAGTHPGTKGAVAAPASPASASPASASPASNDPASQERPRRVTPQN